MTQRIRLTLISVCLVALLTGSISIYYLKTEIEKQFQFGLQRADLMKSLAADSVARSLDLHPSIPIPQALLSDSDLADRLRTIMAVSRSLLEITICDNQNRVLLSTDTSRHPGDPFPADYPDYGRLASQSYLYEKIRVLRDERTPKYYQLSGALGPEGQTPDLFVRVVILPALIRGDRNLIVASGALEKFLGKRRVELMGLSMAEIFPPDASVGFFLEQILETGRPVRNFSVRLDGAQKNGGGKNKLSHALLSVELLESI